MGSNARRRTLLHRHLRRQRRFDRAQTHPAFYHLCKEKQMPSAFRIIGFARGKKRTSRGGMSCARRSTSFPAPSRGRKGLAGIFRQFVLLPGDITDAAAIKNWRAADLVRQRPVAENLLFYLPLASQFASRGANPSRRPVKQGRFCLATHRRRETVRPRPCLRHALNRELTRFAHEQQVCRIDHYSARKRCRTF